MIKEKNKTPKFAALLLGFLLNHKHPEEMIGDYEEQYNQISSAKGKFLARLWYRLQIIAAIPAFVNNSIFWSFIMFRNYLKTSLRIMRKQKGYTIINILGLALGLAICILILRYIQDEMSYDNYHNNVDRLYRISENFVSRSLVRDFATVGPPVGIFLRYYYPEVEKVARLQRRTRNVVKKGNNLFYENSLYLAEQEIFDIFKFDFIFGNPENALDQPKTAVISERIAKKYFGERNPLGETINISFDYFDREKYDYVVKGVIKDPPTNTHLKCDFLLSFKTIEISDMEDDWGWTSFYTYIKVAPTADIEAFNRKIRNIENVYGKEDTKNTYFLQSVPKIHFYSKLAGETEPPGNLINIYVASAICLLILLIACFNFINLSTARSSLRAKEVGVRKVVGAQRSQLIRQFLNESMIITLCSLILSLTIAAFSLPVFNRLMLKEFTYSDFFNPATILYAVLLAVAVGFIAGSYPAFYLSLYRPSAVLKSSTAAKSGGSLIRRILVVSQYTVSITLLILAVIFYRQIDYMKNKDLGFEKEQKLILPVFLSEFNLDYQTVKDEFSRIPHVEGITVSSGVPGYGVGGWTTAIVGADDDKAQVMAYLIVDPDFIPEYRMDIISGRNFIRQNASDIQGAYILNESAVKNFGWYSADEAVGQLLRSSVCESRVIGVVRDFHFAGLQREIEPLVFVVVPKWFRRVSLTVKTENLNDTIALIQKQWENLFPNKPFEYLFFDSIFDRFYRRENRLSKIFGVFTFLGLFIAGLGLFGLASFIVQQRSKEIGIRKVVGASVTSIFRLLTTEFSRLIFWASIFSIPIAYYLANRWLQEFAFRSNLGIPLFVIVCLSVLILSVILVGFQAIKAATANPVESLRDE
ncbi:ABC transporter permease [candidate division KSB1 bacterium]